MKLLFIAYEHELRPCEIVRILVCEVQGLKKTSLCMILISIFVIVCQLVCDKITVTTNVKQINNFLFLIRRDVTTSGNVHTFTENRKAFW